MKKIETFSDSKSKSCIVVECLRIILMLVLLVIFSAKSHKLTSISQQYTIEEFLQIFRILRNRIKKRKRKKKEKEIQNE